MRNPTPTFRRAAAATVAAALLALPAASLAVPSTTIPVGTDPHKLAVDPLLHQVYVGNSGSGSLSIIHTSVDAVVQTLAMPCHGSGRVAVDVATHRVFVANHDCDKVTVVDGAGRSLLASVFSGGDGPVGMALDGPARRAYVANYYGHSVGVLDADSLVLVRMLAVPGPPTEVEASGGRVFVTYPDAVAMYPAGSTQPSCTAQVPGASDIAADDARGRVYVVSASQPKVTMLDAATCAVAGQLPLPAASHGVAFRAPGRLYATLRDIDALAIVSLPDGDTHTLPTGRGPHGVGHDGDKVYVSNEVARTVSVLLDAYNRAPVAALAAAPQAECLDGGAFVSLDASGSRDPDGDTLRYAWSIPGAGMVPAVPRPTAWFPLGRTLVTVVVHDGTVASEPASQWVEVVDTQAPALHAPRLEGPMGRAGWWVGPVDVAVAAADACGIRDLALRLGARELPGGAHVVNADGRHVLVAVARDLGGLTASSAPVPLHIDATPPGISRSYRTPFDQGVWNRGPVEVAWACHDALSGPLAPEVRATTALEGSDQSLTGRCEDLAGNAAGHTEGGIHIDRTPPAVSFDNIRPGGIYANVEDTRVSLEPDLGLEEDLPATVAGDRDILARADDALSGIDRVELHVDGALVDTAREPEAPDLYRMAWAASGFAAGGHEVAALAADGAGNLAAVSLDVVVVPTSTEGLMETCAGWVQAQACEALAG